MKKNIHPQQKEVEVTCTTCKNVLNTSSTLNKDFKIDTCSSCHPFYTGEQKFSNTKGRIDKFNNQLKAKDTIAQKKAADSKAQKSINEKIKENKN